MDIRYKNAPVLVSADGHLSRSVPICLLQAGHSVTLVTKDIASVSAGINKHVKDLSGKGVKKVPWSKLKITNIFDSNFRRQLAIAITGEDVLEKKAAIRQLENYTHADSIIAINTESIPLSVLQKDCDYPARVVGLNWVEPAHTTFFLEVITNQQTSKEVASDLFRLAKACWNKDPYLVCNDVSVRAKMFGAMVREAFFLVQNGYASVEDIDRACRNDAGYYLPFSGNFRYMDLMGVYAYGLVMKDLNPELSRETVIPDFFKEIIRLGRTGMKTQEGFYDYEVEDAEYWEQQFSKFSYEIQKIIRKYPFHSIEPSIADDKSFLQ